MTLTELTEEEALDEALDGFIDSYVNSLYVASVQARAAAAVEASTELNNFYRDNGLPEKEMSSQLMEEQLQASTDYRDMLLNEGGSYVVVPLEGTESYEFRPWVDDLRLDTKDQITDILNKAKTESWTGFQIDTELRAIEEFMIKKRARVAAFTEIRTQQYEAQMATWASGGLEFMERRAVDGKNICLTCAVLDHRVFKMGDQPPLSHPNCRCFYTPYITKKAWSPDYNKTEWDPEGYAVGPSYEYKRGRNMIPYENTAANPYRRKTKIQSKLPLKSEADLFDVSKLSEFDREFYKYVEPERRHLYLNTDQKRKEQLLRLWQKRGMTPKYALPEIGMGKTEKIIKAPSSKGTSKRVAKKEAAKPEELVYFFKTNNDAITKWATENTPIKTVHLGDMDPMIGNDMLKSYVYHTNLEPKLRNSIEYLGTAEYQIQKVNEKKIEQAFSENLKKGMKSTEARKLAEAANPIAKLEPNVTAHSWANGEGYAGIGFNADKGRNLKLTEGRLQLSEKMRWHPEGCNTVKSVMDHEFGHELDNIYGISRKAEIKKLYNARNTQQMTNDLSTYAAKSEGEFVAEAWTEYVNNPHPRPVAKAVGDIMMKAIKGAKK